MENILHELIDKKARIKVHLKNGDFKFITVKILGFDINAYDFHHKNEQVKIKASILLLEDLPKESLTYINSADSVPLSMLRVYK